PPERLGERVPETPGDLKIVASAPGYVTQVIDQRLSEGEEKHIEIALRPMPKPAPEIVVVPPPSSERAEPNHGEHGNGRRTLTYVSFAVSGVGVALGATANARHGERHIGQ